MPFWQAERDFPGDQTSVGDARRYCTERLARVLGSSELLDVSELIVSELVTNAVKATSTQVSVRLTVDEQYLVIGVRDDATGEPRAKLASLRDQTGRGLAIVQALAMSWGVTRDAAGKMVWAKLELPSTALVLACS